MQRLKRIPVLLAVIVAVWLVVTLGAPVSAQTL